MKNSKILFTVEKTTDGYSAYANYTAPDGMVSAFAITAASFSELKAEMLEAYNLVLEDEYRVATMDDIDFRVDLPQFFDFYKEVNAKGVAARAGINNSLLAQYISGKKKPSPKQVGRILDGIRSLGREMASLDLVL
jgi:hypothetical protein